MIETFKIMRKIYDEETVPRLTPSSIEYTRGHQHKRVRYDIINTISRKKIVNR